MPTIIPKSEEEAGLPMASLDDFGPQQIELLATRHREALNERVRAVSAMRSASITADEATYPHSGAAASGAPGKFDVCSLELLAIPTGAQPW